MFLSTAILAGFMTIFGGNFDANLSERSIVECLELTDDSERLACYDRNATLLRAAIAISEGNEGLTGEAKRAEVDENERRGLARLIFGDKAPQAEIKVTPKSDSVEDFGVLRRDGDLKELSDGVTSLSLRADGVAIIVLDNGQVWRQISSDSVRLRLKRKPIDYQATIKKGAVGSFRMRIEPLGKTIRVRRIK